MAVTLTIPRGRVATQASDFNTIVGGAQFAAWSFGAQELDVAGNNSISISNDTSSFNQFTLSPSSAQPVFVAALTDGEYGILEEQGSVLWAYTNRQNVDNGLTFSTNVISAASLEVQPASRELLFDSRTDWARNETTQILRVGRLFSTYDLFVVFYTTSNLATTPERSWTRNLIQTAPFVAGGIADTTIESISDNEFRLTPSANSGVLTAATLNANPQTAGFMIWGV